MTTQPDQRLNSEEREIVAALGEIADNVVPIKRGVA